MRLVLFSNSEHVEMFAMNSNIGNEVWMKQNRHEINIQPILNVGRNFQLSWDFEIKLKKKPLTQEKKPVFSFLTRSSVT